MKSLALLICVICFFCFSSHARDSTYLKVHFLYGSKPLAKYKEVEPKWFGGILGGHVGIEGDSGRILNFVPYNGFHIIAKKKTKCSAFRQHSSAGFYSIFGGSPDSMKKAVVFVPVSASQRAKFDSIQKVYLDTTPYDYAFLGMRCGAAAYDILARLDVLPAYSYHRTYRKIFYPKKLRKRLFKIALANNWRIEKHDGCRTRKWERD